MLTVREVAKELNVGRQTVRRLIRIGAIKAVKLGASRVGYRVEHGEVERLRQEGVPS